MNIRIITLAIVTLLVQNAWAQNTFKAIVKDGKNKEILIGVNAVLNKTTNGASSDEHEASKIYLPGLNSSPVKSLEKKEV